MMTWNFKETHPPPAQANRDLKTFGGEIRKWDLDFRLIKPSSHRGMSPETEEGSCAGPAVSADTGETPGTEMSLEEESPPPAGSS